jgi:hypothetical protein
VTFTAEGGNIQSQCTTATTQTEGGVCSVNFRSSNPRPNNGRVTLLAKAIGEESFVDANGNGSFDNGETFTDQAEPFRDDNESGAYDAGEDFFDFNNDQTRNAADGFFNGVLCKDTTGRCAGPKSTGIGQSNLIILSGNSAVVTQPNGSPLPANIALGTNSAATVSFWVRDLHDNVMAAPSTVALSASGAGLQVVQPTSFTVPCSAIPAGVPFPGVTQFSFTVTSGATTGTGVITLTVTSKPSNLITTYTISITVS